MKPVRVVSILAAVSAAVGALAAAALRGDFVLFGILALAVFDALMIVAVLLSRASPAPLEDEAEPALAPAESASPPDLVIKDGWKQTRAGGWVKLEANAGPAPTIRPRAAAPPRDPLIARCNVAIGEVLQRAQIGFRPVGAPGQTQPAPVRSARTLTFFLVLRQANDLAKMLALGEQLAMRARLDQARVMRYGPRIGIEFLLPSGQWSELPLDRLGDGRKILLGRNTMNRPVQIDLDDDRTPHILLAGTTRCGKSTTLQAILCQLAQADPREHWLLLADSKRESKMEPFYRLPHLRWTPAQTTDEVLRQLSWLAGEIVRRNGDARDAPSITLVMDEAALAIAQGPIAKPLGSVLSVGLSKRVRALLATQRCTKEVLENGMIAANAGMRLAYHVVTADESRLATGQAGLGADKLSPYGDLIAVAGDQATRLFAAMPTPAQLANLPRAETARDAAPDTPAETLNAVDALPPTPARQETTPAQYAAVLAAIAASAKGTVPGINRIAELTGVGNGRATRVQEQVAELVKALEQAGVKLASEADE